MDWIIFGVVLLALVVIATCLTYALAALGSALIIKIKDAVKKTPPIS